jgi:hypothetical protein
MSAGTTAVVSGKYARLLAQALGMFGLIVGVLVLSSAQRLSRSDMPFALLVFPLSIAAVVVHELGHLLAAACAGCTVLGLSVGPLRVERRRFGMRFFWNRGRSRTAGLALAVPDFSKDVRRQVLIFTVGGPVTNLIVAMLLLPISWPVQGRLFNIQLASLFVFGSINFLMGLANLIPYKVIYVSDGLRLLEWWKNSQAAQRELKVLRMYARSLRGEFASDVPLHEIAELESDDTIGIRFFGSYIALRAAQERADTEAFCAVLERCRAILPTLDAITYASIRPIWSFCLIEEEFERICAGEHARLDIEPDILKVLPRFIRYRWEAARAWAEADAGRWSKSMKNAKREIDGLFDAAVRREEYELLKRIDTPPRSSTAPDLLGAA